ncbi:MAG: hypothetical protein AB7F09_06560 [Parvibaculaceae bacterium]
MHGAFNPQDMELFGKVVDEACLKLNCDEALRGNVAARVLSFAADGTRDYETLLAIAIGKVPN